MKNTSRGTLLSLFLLVALTAYGNLPPVAVTISDASGKAAFKGATDGKGTFATANLKPGDYVVQFNSTGGGMKGNLFTIVVSAGSKKVMANAVPGEKFAAGGVAMRLVVGADLNITGQVAFEANVAAKEGRTSNPQEVNRAQDRGDNNFTKSLNSDRR